VNHVVGKGGSIPGRINTLLYESTLPMSSENIGMGKDTHDAP